jgi:hypothetical protein
MLPLSLPSTKKPAGCGVAEVEWDGPRRLRVRGGPSPRPNHEENVGEPFAVTHAHTMAMSLPMPLKSAFSLGAGGDRLVFNAGATTGTVYTARSEGNLGPS